MKLYHPTFMIFVFGSNLSGIHGAGAAAYARRHRGAILHVGEGPAGQSYALPTKGINITKIPLSEVQKHVNKFIEFSKDVPQNQFQVTRVGTGLSGFRDEDIAKMFLPVANSESNCFFDTIWQPLLPKDAKFWGTF